MVAQKKVAGRSARVTFPFKGVLDGEVYPVFLSVGRIIFGALAQEAVEAGWAEWVEQGAVAVKPPAPEDPILAGTEKSSPSAPPGPAKPKKTSKPAKGGRGSSSSTKPGA